MRGVSVRVRPRLPRARACGAQRPRPRTGDPPYTRRAMNVTASPAPKSSILLEIEVPADQFDRAVRDAVGRLSRRTRVAGLPPRQGPAADPRARPRPHGASSTRPSSTSSRTRTARRSSSRGSSRSTNADVEIVDAEEGKPLRFKATVQVRPEVELGDYRQFNFAPEIETIDEPKVDKVVEELRDQNAQLAAVEDRAAKNGDWAVIGFTGTQDGMAFEGGQTERMPLILGEDRLIPGFEANVVGLKPGDETEFDITFPEDYPEPTLAGQQAHFKVDLKELREKILPDADDAFAQSMGDYADMAALKADIAERLGRNALDRARHEFSDKIIEYAVANATIELPDVLIDQEVEVMHDEFRTSSPARASARRRTSRRPARPRRTSTPSSARAPSSARRCCWSSRRSPRPRASTSPTPTSRPRSSWPASATRTRRPSATSSPSAAGTSSAARSAGRRVVETLVDRWLAAHPDHPAAAAPRGRRARRPSTPPGRRPPPRSTPPTRAPSRAWP